MSSISVIIPSRDGYRDGNVPALLKALKRQSIKNFEVKIVKGVSPCSKAHNEGVKQTKGELIVFIDDDITLGSDYVLENVIKALQEDKTIGIAGASQTIPPDSSPFQRKIAKALPRFTYHAVNKITDTDMATHACMAMRRSLYKKLGGENEGLCRGDDLDLRLRVRQAGFRVVVVPNTVVYHPMPKNMKELLKARFYTGIGTAQDRKNYPDLILDTFDDQEVNKPFKKKSTIRRTIIFINKIVKNLLSLNYICVLTNIAFALGYPFGLIKKTPKQEQP